MAFRLDPHRALPPQLARIARKELDKAQELLDADVPGAEAIHDARTHLKRLRALVRLVEREARSRSAKLTRQLRIAAHALSAMREADANLESLAALQRNHGTLITAELADGVRRGLESRKRESRARAAPSLQQARLALRIARALAPELFRDVASRRVVQSGAERTYRGTRRVLNRLALDAGDAEFHLCRRRLKEHFYQMRLIQAADPVARARVRTLNRLEECLGDDHNLAVLGDLILADPSHYGGAHAVAVLLGCITEEQRRLRVEALTRGRRDFRWTPREFTRRLSGWRRAVRQ